MRSGDTGNWLRVDPENPDPAAIRSAVTLLKQGGVIAFPTSGLYGLGADALSERAVRRVFALKRRPADKPVLVLLASTGDMDRVIRSVPDYARPLLTLWPGGLTLIFEAAQAVPPALTGGTGKIGVRLPRHPVAKALTVGFGGPITGTSANISGRTAAASAAEIAPEISRQVDLTLDAGGLAGGPGSTIVDVTAWPIRILREGAVPVATIYHLLRQT